MDTIQRTKTELIPAGGTEPIEKIANFTLAEKGSYFLTVTGVYICNLWFTDGTAQGTTLTKKEIGRTMFLMNEKMIAVDNHLLFKATDKAHGYELWATDGTQKGTYLFWDIFEGAQDGNPTELTRYNNTLYFTAYDKETGGEIRSICLDSLFS